MWLAQRRPWNVRGVVYKEMWLTLEPSDPRCIFSNPSAITQLADPPSMSCLARNSAEEPVAHALLT